MPSLNVRENIILPIGLDGKKVDVDYIEDILHTLSSEDVLNLLRLSVEKYN